MTPLCTHITRGFSTSEEMPIVCSRPATYRVRTLLWGLVERIDYACPKHRPNPKTKVATTEVTKLEE